MGIVADVRESFRIYIFSIVRQLFKVTRCRAAAALTLISFYSQLSTDFCRISTYFDSQKLIVHAKRKVSITRHQLNKSDEVSNCEVTSMWISGSTNNNDGVDDDNHGDLFAASAVLIV